MGARYGQHFLRDPRAIAAILDRFAPSPEDRVVEIGPGRGALTAPLAPRVRALAAVEIDPVLARALSEALGMRLVRSTPRKQRPFVDRGEDSLSAGRYARPDASVPALDDDGGKSGESDDHSESGGDPWSTAAPGASRFVIVADGLSVAYDELARLLETPEGVRLRVIGNLPYGVATALVQRMIAARDRVADATIMVQKEVADRLLAHPGGKEYGFLSVLLGLFSERARVLTLGPGAFSPAPKVRSSVVSLRFALPPPGFARRDALIARIVKIAFSERRKRAASNLARGLAIERGRVERTMEECAIDPGVRAERIDPEAFARLAERLSPGPFA